MLKKLIRNSAIYGLAPSIPKIIGILILPILTKYLTEVDYGIAGTIMAYTTALSAFSTLGFNVCLQVSFFRSKRQFKILWRQIYGFLQLWMIIFAIVQSAILYFIIPEEAIENRWLIILLTNFNGVILGPAGFLGVFYYQYKQIPEPIAVRSLVSGILTIIINYILIVHYKWGYMGWYVSSFASTFIINITYWYDLNFKLGISPIYNFKIRTIIDQLKIALPTIPHYYSVFLINTSNRLVMDMAKIGVASIGQYNMAHQISTYVETGILAIERAASPMCMNAISYRKSIEEKKIVYTYLTATLTSTFLISLWSKQLFHIMINNDMLASTYPYAIFLIMALNYRPLYCAISNVYFYHEKTKDILLITFVAGIIALICNIIFIPIYGIWAAVIINYITFLYQGYIGFFMSTYNKNKTNVYPFKRILLIQIALTIFCFVFQEFPFVFKIVITIIAIFIAIMGIIRINQKNEKNN